MIFTAESYRTAANERLDTAQRAYRERDYVVCMYGAGLAVECLLRAYRLRITPEFDSRHDLYTLYKMSGLDQLLGEDLEARTYHALSNLAQRWGNSYRFSSLVTLRGHLKRIGLDRGVRGDFVKENARLSLGFASEVVEIGARVWPRS